MNRLEMIRERLALISGLGEWRVEDPKDGRPSRSLRIGRSPGTPLFAFHKQHGAVTSREVAEFIAGSRPDIKYLLAEVDRLQAEVDRVERLYRQEFTDACSPYIEQVEVSEIAEGDIIRTVRQGVWCAALGGGYLKGASTDYYRIEED